MVQNINQLCQCGLSVEYITESAFKCFPNSEQQVTFQARFHGTAQVTNSQLIAYLGTSNSVFRTDSTIAVQGLCLDVDSSCSIAINIFGDPQHAITTAFDSTAAMIGGVIALIVVVIVVVAVTVIIIAIAVIKSHRASFSFYQDARQETMNKLADYCMTFHSFFLLVTCLACIKIVLAKDCSLSRTGTKIIRGYSFFVRFVCLLNKPAKKKTNPAGSENVITASNPHSISLILCNRPPTHTSFHCAFVGDHTVFLAQFLSLTVWLLASIYF